MSEVIFESLHLEGPASRADRQAQGREGPRGQRRDASRAAHGHRVAGRHGGRGLGALDRRGRPHLGTLRFKFACGYVHGQLIREYFENEFGNPEQALRGARLGAGRARSSTRTRPPRTASSRCKRQMESALVQGPQALPALSRHVDRAGRQQVEDLDAVPDRLHRPHAGRGPLPRLQQRAARAAPLAAQERLRGQRQPRAEDAAGAHPPLRRDAGAGARARARRRRSSTTG